MCHMFEVSRVQVLSELQKVCLPTEFSLFSTLPRSTARADGVVRNAISISSQ